MIAARQAIQDMSDVARRYLRASGRTGSDWFRLGFLKDSIVAKLLILEHNTTLLASASLEDLSKLENQFAEPPDLVVLISDDDWDIVVKTRQAGALMRLMAFSGVISACVNVADTLGRFINVAYDLRLDKHQASLRRILGKLSSESELLPVLRENPGLDWMKNLRKLRGECQHGAIIGTLWTVSGANTEPIVDRQFCEGNSYGVTISEYIGWARAQTIELIIKAASAIASDLEHGVSQKK